MEHPILYRKRIIPDECVLLKDDEILRADASIIVTRWKALHPKPDLAFGQSCYYLDEGFKVSRFCRSDHSLLYWYCDIIDVGGGIDSQGRLVATDLLVDVIVRPDGRLRVVDLGELTDAYEQRLIDEGQLLQSLRQLDRLLGLIETRGIEALADPILQLLDRGEGGA